MVTTDQLTRPILGRKERRGYGRCDYERFDHLTSSHVNAGRGKIGDVEVDCRFHFTKSRWGYLGSEYGSRVMPGGIIYLDLDFHQPSDCRLRAATVVVTLTDSEGDRNRPGPTPQPTTRPVKFTSHYGPRHMRGVQRPMQKRRVKQFTPFVEVMGQGAGGVGVSSEETMLTGSRWNFSGHLSSAKGSTWDNRLKWVLEENFLEEQSMHSNVIHTAFALEHNASSFFMTVEVTGKLVRTWDQIRQSLKFKDEEKAVTIKFEWKNGYSCPALLDTIAKDLHLAMEHQNMYNVPAEIPDALPASFNHLMGSSIPGPRIGEPSQTPVLWSSQATLGGGIRPELQTRRDTSTQADTPMGMLEIFDISQSPSEPTDQMMRQAAGLISLPPPPPRVAPGTNREQSVGPISPEATVQRVVQRQATPTTPGSTSPRRERSRSLSTATTLVGEEEGQKGRVALESKLMIVLQWVGKMGFLFLVLIGSSFGFFLVESRKHAAINMVVGRKLNWGPKRPGSFNGSSDASADEVPSIPSAVPSPVARKDHDQM